MTLNIYTYIQGGLLTKLLSYKKNEKSHRLNAYYSIERCAFNVEAGKG